MKTYSKLFVTAVVLATLSRGSGQGTFQNLNFENPVLPLTPDGFFQVPITNAIPSWQGYIGANQVSTITYNTISIGAAAISLQGPGSLRPILQGSYSVILQPIANTNLPGSASAAVAQTGQIPAGSLSLRFYSGSEFMQASFAGQTIPLAQLGEGGGGTGRYLILGGDISGYAGQTGELRFTMQPTLFSYNIPYLDNIFFSSQPIPEPSAAALFGLGILIFSNRLRRSARL